MHQEQVVILCSYWRISYQIPGWKCYMYDAQDWCSTFQRRFFVRQLLKNSLTCAPGNYFFPLPHPPDLFFFLILDVFSRISATNTHHTKETPLQLLKRITTAVYTLTGRRSKVSSLSRAMSNKFPRFQRKFSILNSSFICKNWCIFCPGSFCPSFVVYSRSAMRWRGTSWCKSFSGWMISMTLVVEWYSAKLGPCSAVVNSDALQR
jgi:hypothetical protein